jgi:hypothetical protein
LPLYVAGSLLYATATAAIMAINLAMFDRHARGLERRRFFLPRPLPPPEMATAEGSAVPRQPARADAL